MNTYLHLESIQLSPGADVTEVDFFEEHTGNNTPQEQNTPNLPINLSSASIGDAALFHTADDEHGPNVDVLNGNTVAAAEAHSTSDAHKFTIGAKKIAGGGKKKTGGFGAQKVKTNFTELEQKAESFDRQREEAGKFAISAEPTKDDDSDISGQLSARLMVQDAGEHKRQQEKLKVSDPKKYQQSERLGMGGGMLGGRGAGGGVSHSVTTSVKAIQQEGIRSNRNNRKTDDFTFDSAHSDDWEIIGDSSSRSRKTEDDDMFTDTTTSSTTESTSSKSRSSVKEQDDFFSSWGGDGGTSTNISSKATGRGTTEQRSGTKPMTLRGGGASKREEENGGKDAVAKFANAKAISSDDYFGNDQKTDYETRTNLAKFEGRNAIGSADLFGGDSAASSGDPGGYGYSSHVPEMGEIKDSVKQGVSKVAGRISQLGSSVSSYMSDYYG